MDPYGRAPHSGATTPQPPTPGRTLSTHGSTISLRHNTTGAQTPRTPMATDEQTTLLSRVEDLEQYGTLPQEGGSGKHELFIGS